MILLSSTPKKLLQSSLKRKPIKSWVYLGKNEAIEKFVKEILSKDVEQVDYSRELYEVSNEKRAEFVEWLDNISFAQPMNKEWLFSVTSVKNPYSSDLFLTFCYFFVLEKLIYEGKNVDLVMVDSPALAKLYNQYFSGRFDYLAINSYSSFSCAMRTFAVSIYRFLKNFSELIKRKIAARKIYKERGIDFLKSKSNLVFIRNYITEQFNVDEQFDQRFLPGVYSYLKGTEISPVYLPIPVKTSDYKKLFTSVRESKKDVLFPEELLKIQDYLYVMLTPLRALSYKFNSFPIGGYDLTLLVKEDYKTNLTHFDLVFAVLLSKFGARLKEAGVNLQGIVDWGEFQALEKGLVRGLRENYPDLKFIASQPFLVPPNHFSMFPSRQDNLLNIMPNRLLALGSVGEQMVTQYSNDFEISRSPAFRYKEVLKPLQIKENPKNILLLLGYGFQNSVYGISTLAKLKQHLADFDSVIIKLHPFAYFSKDDIVNEMNVELPSQFKFVEKIEEEEFENIAFGFCSATGMSVELVCRGIPVVMIAEKNILTMNYLSYHEDSDMWRLCFSEEEISQAVSDFSKLAKSQQEKLIQKASEFRQLYFAEQSEDLIKNYSLKEMESYEYA